MRINSIPPKDLYLQYVNSARDIRPAAARPSLGTDKVELTDGAKTFSAVLRAAKAGTMDEAASTAKVESVKRRIENNDYNIPGVAVAEKMLGM
ncbi:MAG: flagellar biosynthesis anti-sigma factor FlgM [Clostridiaceae bacterium]|nr:flagellar biosynthesis anti-sigma factor FlgM [Eubacteriales bacterium]